MHNCVVDLWEIECMQCFLSFSARKNQMSNKEWQKYVQNECNKCNSLFLVTNLLYVR